MNIENIIKRFNFEGELVNFYPYGSGHINQTYVVVFKQTGYNYRRYLLQRINHVIFKNVKGLMENIRKVIAFQHQVLIKSGKNPLIESLTLIKTYDNQDYYQSDKNEFRRAYLFVEEGIGYDVIENPDHFYESGVAFGRFQQLLSNFQAEALNDTIPFFHDTEKRYASFLEAIDHNLAKKVDMVQAEIDFFISRKDYASKITSLLKSGIMPYRVTHNDTKLNNVLISALTQKAVCVIDLDTIMSGSIVYDFGDSIRFGANTNKEDEKDLKKVNFSIELFEYFTKGFMHEVKDVLTNIEVDHMAFGAILMTYECGMRFLTGYLNGDTYFKVKYEDHNLDRTRTQMKLIIDMEKDLEKMNQIVKKYIKDA